MSTVIRKRALGKVIVVVGPTASGKTSLGISLAKAEGEKYGGEIISADSRQIYRGMNIGTAKASREELVAITHHLIDIRNPDEDYTVADFKRDATTAIDKILDREKLPIVVGGTGLYIKSLVENLDIPEIAANPNLRRTIEHGIKTEGLEAVFKKLVDLDPEAAYIVDPKNPRRIIRALEVAILTGKPFTAQRKKQAPLYEFLMLGISFPPEILRERIDRRIDEMIRDGLVKEVEKLLEKYNSTAIPPAFDAIGYREIIDYLKGRTSLDAAVSAMKFNTWHFAKRQITWFKKDKNVIWINDKAEAEALVEKFIAGSPRIFF